MGRKEHVIGLDRGADKEGGERDDGEAKTTRQILVSKGLEKRSDF